MTTKPKKSPTKKGSTKRTPAKTAPRKEKPLSARQQIRKCVDEKGADAALALGKKLRMKEATTRAYVNDWIRLRGGATSKAGEEAGKQDHRFQADFRYQSASAARKAADHRAKASGLRPAAFVITQQGQKFAYVPGHLAAKFTVVAEAAA